MNATPNHLPALPRSVRSLVAGGIYGLYRIGGGGAPYLLVTRTRAEFYFLSEEGHVLATPPSVRSIDDIEILAPVALASEAGTVRINVAI